MTPEEVEEKSRAIADRLVKLLENYFADRKVVHVGLYLPMDNEVDCLIAAKEIFKKFKKNRTIEFSYSKAINLRNRKMGFFSILPSQMVPSNFTSTSLGPQLNYPIQQIVVQTPTEPELLLVPLVAFDPGLNRLGYGGGFYDTYLSTNKPLTIGLAYSHQLIDEQYRKGLFEESHNVPLQVVVTESQTFLASPPPPGL